MAPWGLRNRRVVRSRPLGSLILSLTDRIADVIQDTLVADSRTRGTESASPHERHVNFFRVKEDR
jgi:hypothetical protein